MVMFCAESGVLVFTLFILLLQLMLLLLLILQQVQLSAEKVRI